MIFSKCPTTPAEQISLLRKKGLRIDNETDSLSFLKSVSYFRLIPYMRSLQYSDEKQMFKQGRTFGNLIYLYEFDKQLRLLVMDAIGQIEVAIRANINNILSVAYNNAHWHLEPNNFDTNYDHQKLLDMVKKKQILERNKYTKECKKSYQSENKQILQEKYIKDNYLRYYTIKYKNPESIPSWAMFEELSFGELSRLYKGLKKNNHKKEIARQLVIPNTELLESWLHTLTPIRNICAHHGRLWNRELGVAPKQPQKADFIWPNYLRESYSRSRIAIILAILNYFMAQINPADDWKKRLFALCEKSSLITFNKMGLPNNWQSDTFWLDPQYI